MGRAKSLPFPTREQELTVFRQIKIISLYFCVHQKWWALFFENIFCKKLNFSFCRDLPMRGAIFLLFPHHIFRFSWPTCEGAIRSAERRPTWNESEIPVSQGAQGRVKSLQLLIRGSGPGLRVKIRKSIRVNRPREKIHRHFKIHPLKTAPFSPYSEGGDVYGCFRLGSQPPNHKNRRKLYEIQIFL